MTKQQYLVHRKNNNLMEIAYEYYKEKFDSKKHFPYIENKQEFYQLLQMKYHSNEIFVNVVNYFDSRYNVLTIMDAMGNVISIS
jgi:hypothetical protein